MKDDSKRTPFKNSKTSVYGSSQKQEKTAERGKNQPFLDELNELDIQSS